MHTYTHIQKANVEREGEEEEEQEGVGEGTGVHCIAQHLHEHEFPDSSVDSSVFDDNYVQMTAGYGIGGGGGQSFGEYLGLGPADRLQRLGELTTQVE